MIGAESSTTGQAAKGAGRCSLVVGLGLTGLSVARHLVRGGERVRVLDTRQAPPALDGLRAECPDVPVALGNLDPAALEGVHRVVLSPGLDANLPLVVEARHRGIEVVGDIELFAREADAPVIAITGSNGKSTVTALVAHLLGALGLDAPAGGNLAPPALDLLEARRSRTGTTPDVYVLEVSSFQMEVTETLRPAVATVLNISADHLDRHGTIERYAALKAKLISAAETAVFNADDPYVRAMVRHRTDAVPFSVRNRLERGYSVVVEADQRFLARNGIPLLTTDALQLRGTHNEANALAALALVAVFRPELDAALATVDVRRDATARPHSDASDAAACLHALADFRGLPHRCQPVTTHAGVVYIDDSKGTNVGATIAAIEGLAGPLILIAGGLGKGADFAALATAARDKVRDVMLIGTAAPELERAFAGACATHRVGDLVTAVAEAARLARAGDTVLLSPACASQDQFRDYRERGDVFARAAQELSR